MVRKVEKMRKRESIIVRKSGMKKRRGFVCDDWKMELDICNPHDDIY